MKLFERQGSNSENTTNSNRIYDRLFKACFSTKCPLKVSGYITNSCNCRSLLASDYQHAITQVNYWSNKGGIVGEASFLLLYDFFLCSAPIITTTLPSLACDLCHSDLPSLWLALWTPERRAHSNVSNHSERGKRKEIARTNKSPPPPPRYPSATSTINHVSWVGINTETGK